MVNEERRGVYSASQISGSNPQYNDRYMVTHRNLQMSYIPNKIIVQKSFCNIQI